MRHPPKDLKMSVNFFSNSTAIQQMIERVGEQLTSVLRRMAFLHGCTGDAVAATSFPRTRRRTGRRELSVPVSLNRER